MSTPEQQEEGNQVKVGDKFSLNGREWEVKGFDGLYPDQAVITRTEQAGSLAYDVTSKTQTFQPSSTRANSAEQRQGFAATSSP